MRFYEEPQFKSKKAKQQSSANRKRRPNAELKFDIQINVSITNCNGMRRQVVRKFGLHKCVFAKIAIIRLAFRPSRSEVRIETVPKGNT